MNKNEILNHKQYLIESSNLLNEKNNPIKSNSNNFLLDNDIYIVNHTNKNNSNPINKKTAKDITFIEKNLHKFFNEDLIILLNNAFIDLDNNFVLSDSISNNNNSEYNKKENSFKTYIKYTNNIKETNINLNKEKSLNSNDKNINDNKTNNKCTTINKETKKEDNIVKNNRNKIKNKNKKENKENNEKKDIIPKIKNNNNSFVNKFDNEQIIIPSLFNIEGRAKLPEKIREGDWICLFCNNLNFAFRIKCNRCGLLIKSNLKLGRHFYNNNEQKNESHNDDEMITI